MAKVIQRLFGLGREHACSMRTSPPIVRLPTWAQTLVHTKRLFAMFPKSVCLWQQRPSTGKSKLSGAFSPVSTFEAMPSGCLCPLVELF